MTITLTPALLVALTALFSALAWVSVQLYGIKQTLRTHKGHANTLFGPEDANGVRKYKKGLVARVEAIEYSCNVTHENDGPTGQHAAYRPERDKAEREKDDSDPPETD